MARPAGLVGGARGRGQGNARTLRAEVPILEQQIQGQPLAYLDSAVNAQKPRWVLDSLPAFYETSFSNVHRSVYPENRASFYLYTTRKQIDRLVDDRHTVRNTSGRGASPRRLGEGGIRR